MALLGLHIFCFIKGAYLGSTVQMVLKETKAILDLKALLVPMV